MKDRFFVLTFWSLSKIKVNEMPGKGCSLRFQPLYRHGILTRLRIEGQNVKGGMKDSPTHQKSPTFQHHHLCALGFSRWRVRDSLPSRVFTAGNLCWVSPGHLSLQCRHSSWTPQNILATFPLRSNAGIPEHRH